MDDQHLIFLSYASPDRDRVFEWFDYLAGKGFAVWMDKRRLKGGQNWDFEIKRALQRATIIVVFLSANSVDRRGYAQREIKAALDQARDKLIDDIYLIPVMLDEGVQIPSELNRIQVIKPEDGDQMQATSDAISTQLERLGAETARIQGEAELRWTITTHKDQWDGLPGYDSSYQIPRFHSETYPHVGDITEVVRGWMVGQIMDQRKVKFDQLSDHLNFGQGRYRRQNSWEASCSEPKVKERVVTIAYTVWWYGAGAAHPNFGFQTFAFTLDPVTQIMRLQDIFSDAYAALAIIQTEVRKHLLSLSFDGMTSDGEPLKLLQHEVHSGTETWDDLQTFIFGDEGIEFQFGSYHVAPYAFGPQSASVAYDSVARLMRPHFACALGIEHLQYDHRPWQFPLNEKVAGEEDIREIEGASIEPGE
jgi:ribosomal silencing factor RsfS